MAISREPRAAFPKLTLQATRSQIKVLRSMIKRASEIYVWTIEKHQSNYFTDDSQLPIYIDRLYANDPLEWFPRELFLNILRRGRMHYLSSPDAKAQVPRGWSLPFQFKDFKVRSLGIDFTLLEEVPHLEKTFIPSTNTNKQLKLSEAMTTGWCLLKYTKFNDQLRITHERFRNMGMRSDVVAEDTMCYGSISISTKELKLLEDTAKIIGPVRKIIINSMFDHHEATGKYPTWNTIKKELPLIKHQLDSSQLELYSAAISASFYHTAMQALHKFHTEGDAKFWYSALDRVSLLVETPAKYLERGSIHIPKFARRPYMTYKRQLYLNIEETVKIPHVICLYLSRSNNDIDRHRIRFGVYPTDPNRFNNVI